MILTYEEQDLMKKIAVAMSENPRSTIKEIAESVGVSKATLHRFCGTRENLENMLMQRAELAGLDLTKSAEKEYDDYISGLKELITAHYKEYEILRWGFSFQNNCQGEKYEPYLKALNSFFLRGQKQGAFRIDFSIEFLSTMFTSSIYGLIDAERKGRLAKVGTLESFEDFFLRGIQRD